MSKENSIEHSQLIKLMWTLKIDSLSIFHKIGKRSTYDGTVVVRQARIMHIYTIY